MLELIRIEAQKAQVDFIRLIEHTVLGDEGDHRWVLDPPFQRGAVWTLQQKRAWWETILFNLPVPAIFINRFGGIGDEGPEGYELREVVIDGQQRIRATAEFLRDEFTVRGERWSDQDVVTQRHIKNSFICPVYYTRFKTMAECAELYLLLLQTGTAHTNEEIAKAEQFVNSARGKASCMGCGRGKLRLITEGHGPICPFDPERSKT